MQVQVGGILGLFVIGFEPFDSGSLNWSLFPHCLSCGFSAGWLFMALMLWIEHLLLPEPMLLLVAVVAVDSMLSIYLPSSFSVDL